MAQSVSSATPTTGSSFPPSAALAAPRTATDRKTNIASSAATPTNRSSVGGTSSARTTSTSQPPAPAERARGAQETEGGTRPAPASSPAPSSQASSECGDLNLVPPPRPGRRVIPQLLGRLQGSRRLAIVLSAALAAALLTVPMVAILVSGKTIAWRSSGSAGTALYLCNDSVCHAEAHYFDDKLDSAVSPCDDYYAHVCSSHWQRLLGGADLRSAPYASQSPGYAYQALHELAAAYVAQDADRVHQNRHHFGHQILLFVASCAKVSLGSVPGGSRWDWVLFMNGVLKGSAAAAAIQPVAVRSMLYLQRLARLTQVTPTAVLLNYVGYRLMVAMAPFLPGPTGEHLVSLSVEGRRIPGMERLQACVQLVEKVFGAALTVMLRHATPFLSHSDTARKMLGLAHSATDAMAHFIKKAPWLSAEDMNATLSRLSQTSLSLGVPREQPGESELGQLFVDVPMLNERSLLESYFHMKTAVQRRYWSALQRVRRNSSAAARDGAWNNGAAVGLHDVSSFDLAYRHDPERNSVLLPYGVLGFLARVQDVLPMHVPRFLPYALRGLFAAVADMQTVHDDRPSWSRATSLRFAHLSWCFLRQYGELLSAEAGSPAGGVTDDFLAEIVEDNAVLEPLYRVYVRSFPLREGRPALFRLPTLRALSTDELFFVNFAVGQCDQPATAARNGTAARQILFRERLPAKFKVNVPLSNSEHFARVYGCKKGSPMNPVRSCSVWTATG
ncbi:neprilysin-21-like isoform X4 [Dermacentor variabilis]|uniref:neprilysin-21-like isoform X4 n=1 Tax=Dermacentor variabilis TaxID=34621 RepID=UPI003F5C7D18